MSKKDKQKLYRKRRSQKELKKRRKKRYKYNPKKIIQRSLIKRIEEKIVAPSNFSLINNTEEVLCYLNNANDLREKGVNVFFDLSNITNVTPETIALYTANFKNKNYNRGLKIKASGNSPKDKALFDLFRNSGFYDAIKFEHVNKSNSKFAHRFYKRNNSNVDTELAKESVELCSKFTNHTTKFRPLYEILVECMANTNNHASGKNDEKGKYNWWLNLYNDDNTGISYFSFIDLGVGIFKSIVIKDYITKLKHFVSNESLVKDLLSGKIGSSTGLSERGKGFPKIYEHSKHSSIKNFIIISNNVYANLEKEEFNKLNNSFNGTFLYWEIHPIKVNYGNS